MEKLIFEIKAIVRFSIRSIEGGYGSLFKAGIVLIGVSLIGLSQTFPVLIENDNKVRELMFEIEEQENKKIDDIDCYKIKNNIAKCRFVKYQMETNNFTNRLASYIVVYFFYFGLLLLFLSVAGFILTAIKTERDSA